MWESTGTNSKITNSGDLGGTKLVKLEENSATSITQTKRIDLSAFSDITFTFDYRPNASFTSGFFSIEFSNDDGATWDPGVIYVHGTHFNEDTEYYNVNVTISDGEFGAFSSTSKFRFNSKPDSIDGNLFIDNIRIEGTTTGGTLNSNFELWLKADTGELVTWLMSGRIRKQLKLLLMLLKLEQQIMPPMKITA